MSARLPRRVVHRGHVAARAVIVEPALIGEREARARVLALVAAGVRVYRMHDGALLVVLAAPATMDSARAPGLPLAETDGVLWGLPVDRALVATAGQIVRVRGGRVVVDERGAEIDCGEWLAVDELAPVEVSSLGASPAAPVVALPAAAADVRAALAIAAPSAEQLEMRALLRGEPRAGARPGVLASIRGTLARAWTGVRRALAARRAASARRRGPGSAPAPGRALPVPVPAGPATPSWLARLRAALGRLAFQSRLGRWLGRRQAAYLARMLRLFADGDLNQALRHAIPLGDVRGGAPAQPPTLALGVPQPRRDLAIKPGGGAGARTSISLNGELYEHLRRTYRAAFERLAAAGRLEDAAFVLAELLHADEEAVAFLEKHGRLRLAAELAEARALAPGLVVRQWFLAGERGRAVRVARLRQAWADAVVRLERSHPDESQQLRALWADALADAGDFAGAVQAAWPVPSLRPLARAWMQRAVDAGGATGARMLARALHLEASSFAWVKPRALALLGGDDAHGALARVAFGHELSVVPSSPEVAALARPALRAWVRDAGAGWIDARLVTMTKLTAIGGDAALAADLPAIRPPVPAPLLAVRQLQEWIWPVGDVGTMPAADAALLPDGRTLVALGEAGVRLYAADGRVLAHFDQPAQQLVLADHGHSALAIAWRGDGKLIARIDLLARRARRWYEARLSAWAPDHDGSMWFAADGETLYALDVTAAAPEALWSVNTARDGQTSALARSPGQLSAWIGDFGHSEAWTWALPQLTLRTRGRITVAPPARQWHEIAINADGSYVSFGLEEDGPLTVHASGGGVHTLHPGPFIDDDAALAVTPHLAASDAHWFVLVAAGPRVTVHDRATARPRLTLCLDGATTVHARLHDGTLTLCDDRGRVLALDLERGRVLRDLRI